MAFSMAWLAAQVEGKTGDERPRGLLAAFRAQRYLVPGQALGLPV